MITLHRTRVRALMLHVGADAGAKSGFKARSTNSVASVQQLNGGDK